MKNISADSANIYLVYSFMIAIDIVIDFDAKWEIFLQCSLLF